jgi:hypothetical protein
MPEPAGLQMQWQIHSHALRTNLAKSWSYRIPPESQLKPIGGNKAILRWSASFSEDGDWDVANLFPSWSGKDQCLIHTSSGK